MRKIRKRIAAIMISVAVITQTLTFGQSFWGKVDAYAETVEDGASLLDGIVVYSDAAGRCIKKGEELTLTVELYSDGRKSYNTSQLSYMVDDSFILNPIDVKKEAGSLIIKLKGEKIGSTFVHFNYPTYAEYTLPITVESDKNQTYTFDNVPTYAIDGETNVPNFYDFNGIYVDEYTYKKNNDGSLSVSFDVYNTNYSYGAVIVYDANGKIYNASVIDKMQDGSTSIKGSVADNLRYLGSDIWNGNFLSYRQASGFSKKTSVSVKVPKNGCFKITMDDTESHLIGIINGADIVMSTASLVKSLSGYKQKSEEFTGKLTKELVEGKILENLDKNQTKYPKTIWKIWTKQNLTTGQDIGSYGESVLNNLKQLDVLDLIYESAKSCGISIGEDVFTYFMGPVGQVMKGLFTMTKVENLLLQCNDSNKLTGSGTITIKNQGGAEDDTNTRYMYIGDTLHMPKSKGTKFRSSNKRVATVSKKGIVKAKKAGNVTITIKNGKKRQIVKITVRKRPISEYKENIQDNGDLVTDNNKTATIYKDMDGDGATDKIYIRFNWKTLALYYNDNKIETFDCFDGYSYKILKLDGGKRFFYLDVSLGPGDSNNAYLYEVSGGDFSHIIELRENMGVYYVHNVYADGNIVKVCGGDSDAGTDITYVADYSYDGNNVTLCSYECDAGYSLYDGTIAFHEAYAYGNLNLYDSPECTSSSSILPEGTQVDVLRANLRNYTVYVEGNGYSGWIRENDIIGDENSDYRNYLVGLYPC